MTNANSINNNLNHFKFLSGKIIFNDFSHCNISGTSRSNSRGTFFDLRRVAINSKCTFNNSPVKDSKIFSSWIKARKYFFNFYWIFFLTNWVTKLYFSLYRSYHMLFHEQFLKYFLEVNNIFDWIKYFQIISLSERKTMLETACNYWKISEIQPLFKSEFEDSEYLKSKE